MKPFTRHEHDVIDHLVSKSVRDCGALLAEHFPPEALGEDELPNHLIVLDVTRSA